MSDRATRVLVSGVVLGQPPGGVVRHNAELLPRAERLLRAGGGALILLEGRVPARFELPREIERFSTDVPSRPPWRRFLAEGRAIARALEHFRAIGEPIDLVHTAHLPVPRIRETPFTLTLHDLRWLEMPDVASWKRALARRAIASAARRSSSVIAVSESVAKRLRALTATEVVVIPNGADHLPVLPRRATKSSPLLAVGHLEPRKNVELLLRALALDPALPDLMLAGAAKGDHERRLRQLANELGVASRVRFLGFVADERLPELYAEAACVIVPSWIEGFGLAAVEALRAGAPLAVADAGALPEVAGPGVPRFDPRAPASAARAIREALGTNAAQLEERARAASRFNWDESASRLVELWSRVKPAEGHSRRQRISRSPS